MVGVEKCDQDDDHWIQHGIHTVFGDHRESAEIRWVQRAVNFSINTLSLEPNTPIRHITLEQYLYVFGNTVKLYCHADKHMIFVMRYSVPNPFYSRKCAVWKWKRFI